MKKRILLVLFAFVVGLDLSTKYWVVHNLPLIQLYQGFPFGGIGILNSALMKISIVHTTNTGTAWGLFSEYRTLLLCFRIALTVSLLGYLFFFKPRVGLLVPLTLISAGALGNILDMFLYGHVVDMIYCIIYRYSYPIFNVADSAIFCSVCYLVIGSYRKKGAKARASSH